MNEMAEKDVIDIENMIYEIDGKEVMLDSDLAKLYECKNGTKEINQAVKNNPDKFPNDFYFRLSFIFDEITIIFLLIILSSSNSTFPI